MPFILAIESDKRQASRIAAIARSLQGTELVIAESVLQALGTLASRVPDLVLTPLLLSPKDSTALDDRLRELDAAGQQVQTLMTPMLASASARKPTPKTGLLMRLRKTQRGSSPDGCEPDVFAAQITEYLDRAREQRALDAHQSSGEYRSVDKSAPDVPAPDQIEPPSEFAGNLVAYTPEPETPQSLLEPEHSLMESTPLLLEPATPLIEPVLHAIAAEDTILADDLTLAESEPTTASSSFDLVAAPEPEPLPLSIDSSAIFAARLADVSQPFDRRHDVVPAAPTAFDEPIVTTWSAVPWPETPVPIPTDDPALAAEVAAILSTPSPSMTAGEEWVDVHMDLLAAHPAHAPAAASVVDANATPQEPHPAPAETTPAAPAAADDFDVSEFVRALEASLAADVPKKKRRKRAVMARKPVPQDEVQEDEPEPSHDDYDPNADLWMPLPAVTRAIWPQLEHTLSVVKPAAAMPEPALSMVPREATRTRRPVTKVEPDEWGLFDPNECGLAALLAKLDEVNDAPSE